MARAHERRLGGRSRGVHCSGSAGGLDAVASTELGGCDRRVPQGRNRPVGWRELARLVASLARTRVTSARARISRCGLKAQFRVVGCVRGRRFAVVSLWRSLRFFGRGRALACLSLYVRARAVPVRRVTTCAAKSWVGVAADGRGARAWHGRGCFLSPGSHSGGRCVFFYSPGCGAARGLGRHRPCARVPTAVPARAARFRSEVCFLLARALKWRNPLSICIAPGSLRLLFRGSQRLPE